MRSDVAIGMAFSVSIMWAIMVTTAGTLHVNGQTDIQTAEQAVKALEPLVKSFPYAGQISQMIFALGIIGAEANSVEIRIKNVPAQYCCHLITYSCFSSTSMPPSFLRIVLLSHIGSSL